MHNQNPFIPLNFERLPEPEMLTRAQDFYSNMNRRRTVREFSSDPIPRAVIENAILTASSAPSGAHKQPWFFAVVEDPAVKHRIRIAAEKEEEENYNRRFPKEWLEDLAPFGTNAVKDHIDIAPTLIIVFKQNYQWVDGERKKNYYVNESVGIATGMLIAALHNAGLATLTHTPNPMAFLNDILERPKNEVAVILLPVGYPKPDAKVPDLTRKPLGDIMAYY